MADSEFWRRTEANFRKLQPPPPQPGEVQSDTHNGLCAVWTPDGWSSGDQWYLTNAKEAVREYFMWAAESASVELGHPGGPSSLFYWLDLLRRDSPYYRLFGKGGQVPCVCEASADYCLKLETNAKATRLREATEPPPFLGQSKLAKGLATPVGNPQSRQFEDYASFLASFPQNVRAAVEAEHRRAKTAFAMARRAAPESRELKKLMTTYVMRVFLAFASAICKLGSSGQVEIRQIETTCRQFLRLLAAELYGQEVWHDRGSLGKAMMRNSKNFVEMVEGLENTPEWERFRDEYRPVEEKLLADLDRQAKFAPPAEAGDTVGQVFSEQGFDRARHLLDPELPDAEAVVLDAIPQDIETSQGNKAETIEVDGYDTATIDVDQFKPHCASRWEEIEIRFLSDERVQIRLGPNSETRNYAEFGFEDGRTGKANRAWTMLRLLAHRSGTVERAGADQTWMKVEKRIEEIRRVFRKHFGLSDDPVPFIKGTGYRTRFKISAAPSSDC